MAVWSQAMISWLLFGLCGRFVVSHCPLNSVFSSQAIVSSGPTDATTKVCALAGQIRCITLTLCVCVCVCV